MPRRSGSGPLGDITNVTASTNVPAGIPRPVKRSSASQEASPSKLRAVGTGNIPEPVPAEPEEREYLPAIVDKLFVEEEACMPAQNFMDAQPDINSRMRSVLVDWLVEVHFGFRLKQETLFLAVNLLDRYLSVAAVERSRLQLVGVVALFVAAKFEEMRPPPVRRLAYMTAGAYSEEEIMSFECLFLAKLGFKVLVPTAAQFLDLMAQETGVSNRRTVRASFAMELALLEPAFCKYKPSIMAAASLMLAMEGSPRACPERVATMARQPVESLLAPASELRELIHAANGMKLQAVNKKHNFLLQHMEIR